MRNSRAAIAAALCVTVLCISATALAQGTDVWWPKDAQDLVDRLVACDDEFESVIATTQAAILDGPSDVQALLAVQLSIQEQLEEVYAARGVSREQFDQADFVVKQSFSYTGQWTRSLMTGLESLAATVEYALDVLQQPDSGSVLTKDQAYMIRLGIAIAETCKNGALLARSSCVETIRTNSLMGLIMSLPQASEPTSKKLSEWQPIATWSGSGLKTTEPFTITGSPWRVSWKAKSTGEMLTLFQGCVRPIGGGVLDMVYFANSMSEGEDTSYVYLGPGEYYIEISAIGCSWAVTVEDRR